MTARELKKKFLDFFVKKGHKMVPNASLIPENDPTALFINSGMHPLVPYLLGEPHPLGKRLVSNQRCVRTGDIEEVGDIFHHTFFEMLGNWSLGDYWKKEALGWSWEFLAKKLDLDPKKISVTCFAGDKDSPKDEETFKTWRSLGVPQERILFLGKKDNWWAVGKTGPCGPDSEMFYDIGQKACGPNCRPGCQCGKYIEVWNDVFMEFNRLPNGKLEGLKQQNIDTGMGVDRTTAVLQGTGDDYQTELFAPIVKEIESISKRKYEEENVKPMRVIADHLRAATFMIADGVVPSNVEQGYILRRLIRRATRHGRLLGIETIFTKSIAEAVVKTYQSDYSHLMESKNKVFQELETEEKRFQRTLGAGVKEFLKVAEKVKAKISGPEAFRLYETYGFPLELTEEMAQERDLNVDKDGFKRAQEEHRKKSRASLDKKFAGGLADHSKAVTKLHTATHLFHQALRDVLGKHVGQVGSNITPERLRFDFTHPSRLNELEIKRIEGLVNEKIKADLPVKVEAMSAGEAKKRGALAFFGEKYGDRVKMYSIGDYSREVCGGPHVGSTGRIGGVRITKEKPVGAGRRRIYAELDQDKIKN